MTSIHHEEYKGYTMDIHPDECPESPRAWNNVGTFAMDKNYCRMLKECDEGFLSLLAAVSDPACVQEDIAAFSEYISIPLYIVEHGETKIYTTPRDSRWAPDGYYVCKGSRAIQECSTIECAKGCMLSEIATYQDYINGKVYGFVCAFDGQEVDACRGFYGVAEAIGEAKASIDAHIACLRQKAAIEADELEAMYYNGSFDC